MSRSNSDFYKMRKFHNYLKKNQLCQFKKNSGFDLLDVSCGKGGDLPHWARSNVRKIMAIDPCLESLNIAKKRYNKLNIPSDTKGYSNDEQIFMLINKYFNIDNLNIYSKKRLDIKMLKKYFNKFTFINKIKSCEFIYIDYLKINDYLFNFNIDNIIGKVKLNTTINLDDFNNYIVKEILFYDFKLLIISKNNINEVDFDNTFRLKPISILNDINIFHHIKITDKTALADIKNISNNYLFDIVNCQFTLHYFFESRKMLHNAIKNISSNLKTNGYFIGTTLNGEYIKDLIKKNNGENKNYKIVKKWSGKRIFNNEYEFDLIDTNDNSMYFQKKGISNEYLVKIDELIKVCNKYDLELVEIKDFKELYEDKFDLNDYEKDISFLYFYFKFKKI